MKYKIQKFIKKIKKNVKKVIMGEGKLYAKYTNFIKNYIKISTDRAIMITGKWGIGKTFYVKNDLRNELENTMYISLYGIQSLEELSKRLYLLNLSNESEEKESGQAESLILAGAKGIKNSLLSKINFSLSNDDLKKIYKSANFNNKLIIFDDLERSSSDLVIDFMGFVNNLVEHDGAKVLIVCERNELIRKMEAYKKLEEYNCLEQKTIYDTIKFNFVDELSIMSILKSQYFSQELMKIVCKKCCINNEIIGLLDEIENQENHYNNFHDKDKVNIRVVLNYRSIISACFKTKCIFSNLKGIDHNFVKYNFLKIVKYYLVKDLHLFNIYDDDTNSVGLTIGISDVCWDYIKNFKYDKDKLIKISKEYGKYNDQKVIQAIELVNKFYIHDENEIYRAIEMLNKKSNNIPEDNYFSLIKQLCIIMESPFLKNSKLNNKLNYLVEKIANNYNYKDDKISNYSGSFEFYGSDLGKEKMNEIVRKIINKKETFDFEPLNFSFDLDKLNENIDLIISMRSTFYNKNAFLSLDKFNFDNFKIILAQKKPNEIYAFRKMILGIYDSENLSDFFKSDLNLLKELDEYVLKLIGEKGDGIAMMQLHFLKDNIDDIIKRITKK